jgi:hypothetical protein
MRGFWVFRQWRVLEKAGNTSAIKCPDCKIIRRAASSRPTCNPALADISPGFRYIELLYPRVFAYRLNLEDGEMVIATGAMTNSEYQTKADSFMKSSGAALEA